MAATLPTEEQVFEAAIAAFQVAHTDLVTGRAPPVGPRTFLGQQARALASLIGEILAGVKSADDDAVPSTYVDAQGVTRTRNSGLSLDDWAYAIGLPTNSTTTSFGRRVAQAARNGAATATGTPGVVVTTGAELNDLAGTVTLKVRVGFTMPGGGSQSVVIDAETAGEAGNLPVGTRLKWSSAPPGLDAQIILTGALSDGFEVESDVSLALRIVRRLQEFPKGGTPADWREWGESAEDSSGQLVGVVRNYVYKGREGHGSVTVVPTLGGSGRARDPDNGSPTPSKIGQIQSWLDSLKIASDTAYVVRPRFVSGEELTIAVRVDAASGYEFDWLGESSLTVVSIAALALRVAEASLPSSLKAAVDSGDEPRIAIQLASSPLPAVVRVTAYAENSPAGDSTLTLEKTVTVLGGELVYEAGGATIPIAANLLAYVDNVGPSRKSGYADPHDEWEDAVSIGRIAQTALSARDPDSGDLVAVWSPGVGVGVGVTIQVGSGSASGEDFILYDNVPGQGPQLPECAAIVVRRAST